MLRGFFSALTDIIYPKVCVVCKESLKSGPCVDNLVCRKCWEKIRKNSPPFCRSCGRQLKKPVTRNICPACVRQRLHFDRAFAPCSYEGVVKELIHAFKYQGKDYLGATLTRLIIEFIEEYKLPVDMMDMIVPIPLHSARLREREFNQAEVLSNHIAGKFNKDVTPGALLRLRHTRTQTDLEINERLWNVKGSFAVAAKERVKGKNILLVDDVLTSAATCSEGARALKEAGANIVFVLTLAN